MKITVTAYGTTVSIEEERDDLTIQELGILLRKLTLALGYHPDSVSEILDEDIL